jgi:hypothetical protein
MRSVDLQGLPHLWRAAPRRWGHSLLGLCSYMAMFPPSMPHTFIKWLTEPGDTVFDPFCGRGTTPLEACLLGRRGLGSDASPLAWVLSAAKVDPPTKSRLQRRLAELRDACGTGERVDDAPPHVRMLFSPRTLRQLQWLRGRLDLTRRLDRFLMATLLGILHANADISGRPRGLSIAMPNTFSMAPNYIANYIEEHGLIAPRVDVFDALYRRLEGVALPERGFVRGRAWRADAAENPQVPAGSAKLIFTSPPYLQAILYGKFNWIRLWMLGHEPKAVDSSLFTSSSLRRYLTFMQQVISGLREAVRDDGYACLVIGDVRRDETHLNLAHEVMQNCVDSTDFRPVGVVVDHLPVRQKVSRIWKENKGRATKTDRIIVLAGPKARVPRKLPTLKWT